MKGGCLSCRYRTKYFIYSHLPSDKQKRIETFFKQLREQDEINEDFFQDVKEIIVPTCIIRKHDISCKLKDECDYWEKKVPADYTLSEKELIDSYRQKNNQAYRKRTERRMTILWVITALSLIVNFVLGYLNLTKPTSEQLSKENMQLKEENLGLKNAKKRH